MYSSEEVEEMMKDIKQHSDDKPQDVYHRDEFELHTVHERLTDSGLRRLLLIEACCRM